MYKILTDTLFVGKQVVYLPTCPSTNETATQLLATGQLYEGALVITDSQTAGKGQRGNRWQTHPHENLTFSVLFAPHFLKVQEQFRLTIAVSLAVMDCLQTYIAEGLKIKWPNDLYYYDNKLGGILIENTLKNNIIRHAVVGIGLNVNQTSFDLPTATSLQRITGQTYDKAQLINNLLKKLESRYLQLKNGRWPALLTQYYERMYWMDGQAHTFQTAGDTFSGIIQGVDAYGRLQLLTDSGLREFAVKEIQFLVHK